MVIELEHAPVALVAVLAVLLGRHVARLAEVLKAAEQQVHVLLAVTVVALDVDCVVCWVCDACQNAEDQKQYKARLVSDVDCDLSWLLKVVKAFR